MLSIYNKVRIECDKNEKIYTFFGDRLYSVVQVSEGVGWGYHEALCEIYYSIEWLSEDE